MQSPFTNTFFTNNRAKLRGRLAMEYPVVFIANGSLQRSADTTYPFQQESNFWYLTGLDEPDLLLVMDRTQEYLILPKTNRVKTIFDGGLDIAALQARSGITMFYDASEGWQKLVASLGARKAMYTLSPEQRFEPQARIYANPAQRYGIEKLRRQVGGLTVHDVSHHLTQLRMRKQAAELTAIETAVRITTETIQRVRTSDQLAKMTTEYALEAAITNGFRAQGARGHAYDPIIASGMHATTLHYVQNNGQLATDELIVADVGAEYEHYAADITRTLARSKPNPRQQAVLSAVIDIQHRAAALLRPGTILREYERTVAAYTGEALHSLGLTTNARDMQAIRTYFPHASSHFLGLDVHDVADYEAPLEESMVLTCEPGMYIPEEGIGVRIEDDIVITATGNRNLSAHCSYSAYVL